MSQTNSKTIRCSGFTQRLAFPGTSCIHSLSLSLSYHRALQMRIWFCPPLESISRDEWRFNAKPRWPCWFLTEINGHGEDGLARIQTVTPRLLMPPGSLCLIVAGTLWGHYRALVELFEDAEGGTCFLAQDLNWGVGNARLPRGTSCWGLQCCWKIIYLCSTC